MRAALISDLHLEGGPDDPVQKAFVDWLDHLEVDALSLLGDVFHGWWGYRDVVPARLVATCAALERVRNRGVAIHVCRQPDCARPILHQTLGADGRPGIHA